MLRRELAIAFRARVTWLVATLAALLVGHGFVLAVDVYASASRSVIAGTLMSREMDPLAAIVRPTLGGAQLAVTLFVPIIAARLLAVEKERRSFGALALALGSPVRVLYAKLIAAAAVSLLVVAPAVLLICGFALMGGHVDLIETSIALAAHLMHALFIASVSVAAAAWTRTVAQATTVAIVVAVASWILDAGEGFAALAWLGPLEAMSVTRALAPLEQGLVSLGSIAWLLIGTSGASLIAIVGARFDLSLRRRRSTGALVVISSCLLIAYVSQWSFAFDWTEYRRASYPLAVADAMRAIDQPIILEVWLDREDSRRRHLERDALSKIRLTRANVLLRFPLDTALDASSGMRDQRDKERDNDGHGYGRIVIRVGDRSDETRSTSRREIATRIFEVAGRDVPSFDQVAYPGYPAPWNAQKLKLVRAFAYLVVPCIVLAAGVLLTRRRRRH